MINLSESLVYYTNAINGNETVLVRLRSFAEKQNYPPQMIELLDDLIIENTQCYKQADVYATVFAGLMDARGTLINNNMSILLRKLTIINIVFLPLNLIAGIGGMSEFSMMTQGIHWRISYFGFVLGIVLIGWLTYFLLGRIDPGVRNPIWSGKRKKKNS
jgi:magnesium transporter